MSNEPSKRIERMLRKWARQRRDAAGAGWPVHPATRRLLQGEVARTLGARGVARAGAAADATAGRGWLALFWPRLVWGAAGLALIVLVWVWLPRSAEKPMEMAAVNQNAPVALDGVPDRPLNDGAKSASPSSGLSPAPAPKPPAAGTDERAKLVAAKREKLPEAESSAAEKDRKQTAGGGAAPAPADVTSGARVVGATPQPLLELSKKMEAKVAGEKSELLERRRDAQPPAPVATSTKELADRDQDRTKDLVKLSDAALGVAPISAPAAASRPMATLPTAPLPTAAPARSESSGGASGRVTALAPAGPAAATAMANARPLPVAKTPAPGVATTSRFRQEPLTAAAAPVAPDGASESVAQHRFIRLNAPDSYRRNLQSPPSPALLQQFQIQRAGNVVTVVDEDGSVYQGQVIAAETPGDRANRRLPELQRKDNLAAADKAGEKNAGQPLSQTTAYGTDPNSYWFRASGTNRSLKQPVVFTGEFQSGAGGTPVPAADLPMLRRSVQLGLVATNSLPAVSQSELGTNATPGTGRIQGRARVGASSEIQVEAVSSGSQRR